MYLLNPCLTWTRLCGNQNCPAGPPASLLLALSSSEPLLANFKEFTSKAFGRHRTAQAEVVASSFAELMKSWILGKSCFIFLLFIQCTAK